MHVDESLQDKFLTFTCDNQLYAIPINLVIQIIGMQEITEIPDSPPYAKGIINLRGNIIPIIDTRLRFKKPEIPYTHRTCTIIAKINDLSIGFVVDGVEDVETIDFDAIVNHLNFQVIILMNMLLV